MKASALRSALDPSFHRSIIELNCGLEQDTKICVPIQRSADIRCDVEVDIGYLLGRVAAWLPRFFD